VEDRVSIKRILDNFDKNGKTSGLYIEASIKFYLLIGQLNKALLQMLTAIYCDKPYRL
jgi:hypothetical protein